MSYLFADFYYIEKKQLFKQLFLLFYCLKPKNISNGYSCQIHCRVIDFFMKKKILSPSILLPKNIFLGHLSDHQTQNLFTVSVLYRMQSSWGHNPVLFITMYVMSTRTMPVIWLVLYTYVWENQILCIFHLGGRMNTDIMTLRNRDWNKLRWWTTQLKPFKKIKMSHPL